MYINELASETIQINLAFKQVKHNKVYEMFASNDHCITQVTINLTTANTNAQFPVLLVLHCNINTYRHEHKVEQPVIVCNYN
jgi:hypothetical protein